MATPHVAGVAALYLAAHPDAGTKEVRQAIRHNSSTGVLHNIGDGSPDKLLYSQITSKTH
jgi:subtilisin family serine protease